MNLKRRQFLFLSSFSAIGTGFLAWMLTNQNHQSADITDSTTAIAANPVKKTCYYVLCLWLIQELGLEDSMLWLGQ